MHEVTRKLARVTALIASVLAGALCSVDVAGAQVSPPAQLAPTGLLSAVLAFRLAVVESSTPIKACSVVKLMDTPGEFPQRFPIAVQNIFDRRVAPCESVVRPTIDSLTPITMKELRNIAADPGCVMIDSVRRVDSLATVYASAIRQGDAVHSEEFRARYQASRQRWVVTEVRLYGLWYPHGGGCP